MSQVLCLCAPALWSSGAAEGGICRRILLHLHVGSCLGWNEGADKIIDLSCSDCSVDKGNTFFFNDNLSETSNWSLKHHKALLDIFEQEKTRCMQFRKLGKETAWMIWLDVILYDYRPRRLKCDVHQLSPYSAWPKAVWLPWESALWHLPFRMFILFLQRFFY